MASFQIEYYPRASKDLEKLRDPQEAVRLIDEIGKELSMNPFPNPPRKKRIQGISWPLFRLRIDTAKDSYRAFYAFRESRVIVLRVIKKKDAEKIIRSFR